MFKFLKLFGFDIEFGLVFWDVGSALSIGSSVVGGLMGNDAADEAGKASAKATAASNAMLKKQAEDNKAAYSPFINTGTAANNKLAALLGLDMPQQALTENDVRNAGMKQFDLYGSVGGATREQMGQGAVDNWRSGSLGDDEAVRKAYAGAGIAQSTPITHDSSFGSLLANFSPTDLANDTVYNTGLKFGLDEGTKGLNRQAAAIGSLNSGATLKALTKYANDYGTTKAAGAYDRFNNNKLNTYNMLSGQQGVGLNATNGLTGNNTSLMIGQANNTMTNGANQANAAIAGNAATTNAINGGIGNYLFNKSIAGA